MITEGHVREVADANAAFVEFVVGHVPDDHAVGVEAGHEVVDHAADALDTARLDEPVDSVQDFLDVGLEPGGDVAIGRRRERETVLDREQEIGLERREVADGLLADPGRRGVGSNLERFAREPIRIDDGKLEVDVVVGQHREVQDRTAGSGFDVGQDLVAGRSRAGGDDEPHVPLVVASVVVVDLPIVVDHVRNLLEPVLGGSNGRQRRRADHRRVKHGAESSKDPVLVESTNSLEGVRFVDPEVLAEAPKRPLFDRKTALVAVDDRGVHVVDRLAPVPREGTHWMAYGRAQGSGFGSVPAPVAKVEPARANL